MCVMITIIVLCDPKDEQAPKTYINMIWILQKNYTCKGGRKSKREIVYTRNSDRWRGRGYWEDDGATRTEIRRRENPTNDCDGYTASQAGS